MEYTNQDLFTKTTSSEPNCPMNTVSPSFSKLSTHRVGNMSIFALLCFVFFFSFALLIFDFVMEAVSAGFVVDLRD